MNAPPRHEAALTVTLVVFCQGFNMLSLGGIALFLPLIREDLHMSFAQAGMLSAAATFTYALGQIPGGYLADASGRSASFSSASSARRSCRSTSG
jgi:MFS family permease